MPSSRKWRICSPIAPYAGVAGVHPRHILALGMGRLDQLDDLFQVQFGAVDHLERLVTFQYGGGHQRAA